MFHLGFLFQRPVTVNVIRDGVADAGALFSRSCSTTAATSSSEPLPVNLGFAGFRLHYPLNDPEVHDELIAFLGASYFRFLGRGQRYGLSARGLAIDVGAPSARSSRSSASSGSRCRGTDAEPRRGLRPARQPLGRPAPTSSTSTRPSETTLDVAATLLPAQADRQRSASRR